MSPTTQNCDKKNDGKKDKTLHVIVTVDMDLLKPSMQLYGPWFPCVFDDSSSPQDQEVYPGLLPMS